MLPLRSVTCLAAMPEVRRSSRLLQGGAALTEHMEAGASKVKSSKAANKRAAPAAEKAAPAKKAAPANKAALATASRAREESAWKDSVPLVIGCDEAGRGPLAGPVVAASCALPEGILPIVGVGDSKTITDEAQREALYEQIISTPGVLWSARVVSAARIDEINIVRHPPLTCASAPVLFAPAQTPASRLSSRLATLDSHPRSSWRALRRCG